MITGEMLSRMRSDSKMRFLADSLEYISLNKDSFESAKDLVRNLPVDEDLGEKIVLLDGYGRNIYLSEIDENIVDVDTYEDSIEQKLSSDTKEDASKVKEILVGGDMGKIDEIDDVNTLCTVYYSYFDAMEEIGRE